MKSKRTRISQLLDHHINEAEESCKSYRGTSKDNAVILAHMYSERTKELREIKSKIENIIDEL